jgi:(5-formylfuran-3-yl)methyl phosphate synthase
MTGLLASVTNPAEAFQALEAGADIIDCKDPAQGALGALPVATIGAIVERVGGRRPVSATVGDLPSRAEALVPAVCQIAATGVDYVKLGLFDTAETADLLVALTPLAAAHRLIAVLFADRTPRLEIVAELATAGFSGVMLDTAGKDGKTLLGLMEPRELGAFVRQAQAFGLLCGLAGSLRGEHIPPLLELHPDYLGFRGALCEEGRVSALSPTACAQIRAAIPVDPARAATLESQAA